MAEKKANAAYQQLKQDIAAGTLGTVYIFHGEETYLREYYLDQAVKKLVPAGLEEFNYHKLEGKGLTVQDLTELVEAMPMLSERTVVQVVDFDIFKLGDEQRRALAALGSWLAEAARAMSTSSLCSRGFAEPRYFTLTV